MTTASIAYWKALRAARSDSPLVLFFGDSISRGFAFGKFDFDPVDHLSTLQHPDRILNVISQDASLSAAFGGVLGTSQLKKIQELLYLSGDWIVYQDWGWRPESYDATLFNFLNVASTCKSLGWNVLLLSCYSVVGSQRSFDWDCALDKDARSANDAILAAGALSGARVCDVRNTFARALATASERLRPMILLPDKIHPGPIGNVLIAIDVYRAITGRAASIQALIPTMEALCNAPNVKCSPQEVFSLISALQGS